MKKTKFDLFTNALEVLIGLVALAAIIVALFTKVDTQKIYMPLFIAFYCVQAYNRRDSRGAYIAALVVAVLFFVMTIFLLR